jgi:GrpB-like predicted nucleotidyltransferase (UPF0157 family)
VDLVAYDPRWPIEFDVERRRIAAALGALALRIEHNGSTAVPGLAAKPIIDIQISVARLQPLEPYVSALSALGYVHVPHPDDRFCPFLQRPASWPHTHHVHLVEAGGEEERRTLAFRDRLRARPELAAEYEALKRDLAARYPLTDPSAREKYAASKSAFIERVLGLPA